MKLLLIPNNEDPILNRIDSLKRALEDDDNGEYLDELLLLIINFCMEFPSDCPEAMRNFESKMQEARFWANEFFSTEDIEDEKKEELEK